MRPFILLQLGEYEYLVDIYLEGSEFGKVNVALISAIVIFVVRDKRWDFKVVFWDIHSGNLSNFILAEVLFDGIFDFLEVEEVLIFIMLRAPSVKMTISAKLNPYP